MPKTVVKIKTWLCDCGYMQDFEPTPELMAKHKFRVGFCPSCGKENGLRRAVGGEERIEHTVMGEEDIAPEIEEIKKGKYKVKPEVVDTPEKENAYINKRKQDIKDAIKESRKYKD